MEGPSESTVYVVIWWPPIKYWLLGSISTNYGLAKTENSEPNSLSHRHRLLMIPLSPFHPPFVVFVITSLLFNMAPTMNRISSNTIMYLIHHIFLPPKLPHGDDVDANNETILLDITIDGLLNFKDFVMHDQRDVVDSVIDMVTNLRTVRDCSGLEGTISEGQLENAMRDLRKKGKPISRNLKDSSKQPKVGRFRFTYAPRMPGS